VSKEKPCLVQKKLYFIKRVELFLFLKENFDLSFVDNLFSVTLTQNNRIKVLGCENVSEGIYILSEY
jgi:hypothetical protein